MSVILSFDEVPCFIQPMILRSILSTKVPSKALTDEECIFIIQSTEKR